VSESITVTVTGTTSVTVYPDNISTSITITEVSLPITIGSTGPAGIGLPIGGTANQILTKVDGADYNVTWADPSAATTFPLGDLTDVTLTTPVTNSTIKYDGAGWINGLIDYSELANVPTTFTPATHTHTLSDITDAGTAAASNTGDFEASGAVSTHAAVTSGVHGISAFGATLVDDADAAAARTTLGLGTAATTASTAYVPDGEGVIPGGTTGQILAKASNTDHDLTWINQSSISIGLSDLNNVTTTLGIPGTPYFLKYDDVAGDWVDATILTSDVVGFTTGVQALVDASAKNSIESDASEFQLVNDSASPGGTKLYGTDGFGTKGWQSFPGLSALSDVNLLTVTDNQVLQYNNGTSRWENATLTITESQITDGSILRRFSDTIDLATYVKDVAGTQAARSKRMVFGGQISGVSFSLDASDTGTITVRVVNDSGTNTSVGTADITSDDSAADASITWSTGTGSFSAGDRIEMEATSGFATAVAATITAYGTRSN
jgi:hypothetical protein